MPSYPPSPPSDCASTHSVGTDTDPGIYACYTVMMVNRPILDRYNEDGSGPAMVADSTRTHMAAGQEREREGQKEREEGKRKGKRGEQKGRKKRRNRKREDGGEKGRRNPQTEKKEKMVALELLCYVLDIYTYMSYVCVPKEEIVASGNAAKKKRGERTNVAILNAPSHTHRGQPANTNYCKGQASGNADAVLQKKRIS